MATRKTTTHAKIAEQAKTDPAVMAFNAGLDIGNGYVKGVIEPVGDVNHSRATYIDMPSAVAQMTQPNRLPDKDVDAVDITADDFVNKLDAQFTSPVVPDTYRRVFGTRSLATTGGSLDQFDLVGHTSKADQVLSKVLVLGVVASKAVADYVGRTGYLPDPAGVGALRVSVVAALALPINEFTTHRGAYASAFTGVGDQSGQVHTVTVTNFDTPVTVQITFEEVRVIAEGASAIYAINGYGEPLMEQMLSDVRSRGIDLPGVTATDVITASDIIGVDIGEGTVNFPVFTDYKFNTDASRTFAQGYGTVLENALVEMENDSFNAGFTSRKQLADFLVKKPSNLKRNFYDKVAGYVHTQATFFVRAVAEQFARVLADVGMRTEVAYVYGGGSGPLHDDLHPALMAKVAEMVGGDATGGAEAAVGMFPVMYLDVNYSRNLNREGLMIAASSPTPGKKK